MKQCAEACDKRGGRDGHLRRISTAQYCYAPGCRGSCVLRAQQQQQQQQERRVARVKTACFCHSCKSVGAVPICRVCVGDDDQHALAYDKRGTRQCAAAKPGGRRKMPTFEEV